MVLETRRMTVAEFLSLPDDGRRHELVRGEVRTMPPPKSTHGVVETVLLAAIDRYLYARALAAGWTPQQDGEDRYHLVGLVAGGEFGIEFATPDDPHQVRGADGAYVPPEQLAHVSWSWGDDTYFPGVPHLVIEVISHSEKASDSNEKVQDYLAGGARRVWCLYPEHRTVHVHDPDVATRVLRWGEVLADEELLPGFSIPLNHLFPRPSRGRATTPGEQG